MEILIRYQAPDVEKPGVSAVRRQKEIGRARARLQTCGQPNTVSVGQVSAARRNLGAERDGCLCGSSLRVSPVEAVFYEYHSVTKASAPDRSCRRPIKS